MFTKKKKYKNDYVGWSVQMTAECLLLAWLALCEGGKPSTTTFKQPKRLRGVFWRAL